MRLHLALQTGLRIGLVDLVAMKTGRGRRGSPSERARARIVALDVVDEETLASAGELVWATRPPSRSARRGSQYALIAHWREAGLIGPAPGPARWPRRSASPSSRARARR